MSGDILHLFGKQYKRSSKNLSIILNPLKASNVALRGFYILNRWYFGDFSRADKDPNEIWVMKGGTIGKANGLLSPIEEQEFIENTLLFAEEKRIAIPESH